MSELTVTEPTPPPVLEHFQDRGDGDLTIRCADGGEVYVYRIILSAASPVFKDMLSLSLIDHTVEVTEDSRTVERLLQFCYPQDDPVTLTLTDIHRVLKACDKYQMEGIGRKVVQRLREQSIVDPLRVFCVACDVKLVDVAKAVAFECLREPQSYLIADRPEMRFLDVKTFAQLLRYHASCTKAATDIFHVDNLSELHWIDNPLSRCWFQCQKCEPLPDAIISVAVQTGRHRRIQRTRVRKWWAEVMTNIAMKLEKVGPMNYDALFDSSTFGLPPEAQRCAICGPAFYSDMTLLIGDIKRKTVEVMRQVKLELDR